VDLPELPLTAQIRHNLYLAFKEALNNVVKYAGATEVRISLEPGDGFFTLRVQDNGGGIDPNAPADPNRPNAGSGLANMESRMHEIGGTCVLESSPGQGTSVEFRVPLDIKP
jgi:signal transduction histidine kinase